MPVVRVPVIKTARLTLRPWRASDLPLFAEQNRDPEAMMHLGGTFTRPESDAYVADISRHFEGSGFGKWAVEAPNISPFIGTVGLTRVPVGLGLPAVVEVAWYLNRQFWGQGFATEAARAAIADGFTRVGLPEVIAVTTEANIASRRVMERLGMSQMINLNPSLGVGATPPEPLIVFHISRDRFLHPSNPATRMGSETLHTRAGAPSY